MRIARETSRGVSEQQARLEAGFELLVSSIVTTNRRRRAVICCVLSALLLPLLWRHAFVDLRIYGLGGMALLDDPDTIYTARLTNIALPFTYPPFAALVMVPLALVPWQLTVLPWTVLSVVSLVVICRLSLREVLGRERVGRTVLLAVVPIAVLYEPVRETIGYGQINLILCALVMHDLLAAPKRWRGVGIGIAAGIKLVPLVFFGLLLVTRQWRALGYASATFLGTVAAGFAVAPRAAVDYWSSYVSDTARIGGLPYSGNQSWNALLIRLTGDLDGGGWPWYTMAALTTALGLWLCRRLWQQDLRVAAVSVCGLIGLLCSPVSWSHHWVWVVPLGLGLLTALRIPRDRMPWVAVGWSVVFILGTIWWPPNKDNRELSWNLGQVLLGNAYVVVAAAVMLVLLAGTSLPAPAAGRSPLRDSELAS